MPAVDLVLPVVEATSERSDSGGIVYNYPRNAYNICLQGIKLGTAKGTYEEVTGRARDGVALHIQPAEGECVFQNNEPDRQDGDFYSNLDFRIWKVQHMT